MKVGEKVEHVLSKDWVLILFVSVEDDHIVYDCRTKSLDIVRFFDFELRHIK